MQTDGGGEQAASTSVIEYVEDEEDGRVASGPVPEVPELPEVDEGQNDFNEINNDKSEVSDEDFRSIKTVDDNANDFEGNRPNIDRVVLK